MSTYTSTYALTRSPPPLPNELISQILQSPRLSKPDLARCCLVNRLFLPISQSQLYQTVTICFCQDDFRGEQLYYSETSRLLIRTLEGNIILSRKVFKLYFKGRPTSRQCLSAVTRLKVTSFSKAIELILNTLPQVNSLRTETCIWDEAEVRDIVMRHARRWVALDLRPNALLTNGTSWPALPHLKRLACAHLARRPEDVEPLPASLEVLKINGNRPELLRGSPNAQLRILHVVGSAETLSNVGDFQELQHLHIFRGLECQPLLPSSAFSAFSQLAHLRSLSLALWSVDDPILTATLPSLLAHLPRSLDRLDFPERTPIEILSSYLKIDTSPPFQFLSVSASKFRDLSEDHLSMRYLRILASTKGIEIEFVGKSSSSGFSSW